MTRADGEQKIQVFKFLEHPQYNRQNQDNDFAIITLSIDVTFSNSVMPVCLPDPSNNYNSRVSTVTGWGTFSSGSSSTPNTLYEVDVKTISNSACTTNTQYGSGDVTGNMICAKESGKDACQGLRICIEHFRIFLILRRLWRSSDHQGGQQLLLHYWSRFLGYWLCSARCSWCLLQGHK